MSTVPLVADRDSSADIVRLVALHAGVVFVPVLVVAIVVVPVLAAVVLAAVVSAGLTAWRLRGIDRRIVTAVGAVPVDAHDRPRLHSVVESAVMSVGVAPPRLYVIDSPARNAVTWSDGIGPVSAAFTTGLLDAVDRMELEAVVGRQFTVALDGHLDIVTIAGALFGPLARGPLEDAVASLVHRTVDDRSVVLADLDGVRATKYPPGLVAALERVRGHSSLLAGLPPWLSSSCFAAPIPDESPFAVHPPLEDRIDLLREI